MFRIPDSQINGYKRVHYEIILTLRKEEGDSSDERWHHEWGGIWERLKKRRYERAFQGERIASVNPGETKILIHRDYHIK